MISEPGCVSAFYKAATEFYRYVQETTIKAEDLDQLICRLMSLYQLALQLPNDHLDVTDQSPIDLPERIEPKLQFRNDYLEIFDPFRDEEPVGCSLYDDLSDICRDLQEGIAEYEAGRIDDAVFDWSLSLDSHWGQHAVDAIKALHTLRTE